MRRRALMRWSLVKSSKRLLPPFSILKWPTVYATSKEISHEDQGLTAVEKIFNKNAVGVTPGKVSNKGGSGDDVNAILKSAVISKAPCRPSPFFFTEKTSFFLFHWVKKLDAGIGPTVEPILEQVFSINIGNCSNHQYENKKTLQMKAAPKELCDIAVPGTAPAAIALLAVAGGLTPRHCRDE